VLVGGGFGGTWLMLVGVLRFLTLCSFPPSIQFFSEVFILASSSFSAVYLIFWGAYLFLGGLVPLVLCAHCLIRSECVDNAKYLTSFIFYLFILSLFCFGGFIFI
jgi:hypothetical protein